MLGLAPLVLIRFEPPRYSLDRDHGEVSWQIGSGLLVAPASVSDRGCLRIGVRREQSLRSPDDARLHLSVQVEGYAPRLRGRGRFARAGAWIYAHTQLRVHAWQSRAFMQSLARDADGHENVS